MATCRIENAGFVERAPVRFVASRVMAHEPKVVFGALADAPRWPEWFGTVSSIEWLTDPPHGVGSRRRVRIGPVTVDEEFVVWEPGTHFGFTFLSVTGPPLVRAGVETVTLEPTEGGTQVTYTMAIEPAVGGGLVGTALGIPVRKGLRDGLAGLDRYLSQARGERD